MRLGGPVFSGGKEPETWIEELQQRGYRAAYCPVGAEADASRIAVYAKAALEADIVIAEVGAWSNPLSVDADTRQKALEHCKAQLALADRIGALCCVNISGSRGTQWDGPHADNLTEATFDLIVASVQEIIDAVRPDRTFYTLETMPWMYPDSVDSYLQLITAIDRPRFAVHLDPVNLISGPSLYFDNAGVTRECFAKLGPYIKSCHIKDITLSGQLMVHLDEVRPGAGSFDYRTLLTEAARLDPDLPLMLEHLPSEEEYTLAADFVRSIAAELGL